MKKFISIFLACMLFLGFLPVSAAENGFTVEAKVNMQTVNDMISQTISVKITTNEAIFGRKCGLFLVRPLPEGTTPASYSDSYAAVYAGYTDTNGVWALEFPFADASGEYQLRVTVNGIDSVYEENFYIPSSDYLNQFIAKLKNQEVDASSLCSILKTKSREIGVDVSVFEQLPETVQNQICEETIQTIDLNNLSIENFVTSFDVAVILNGIEGNVQTALKQQLLSHYEDSYLKLCENPLYADYKELGTTGKENVIKLFDGKNVSSINEVKNTFFDNLFVAKIQDVSVYTEISSIAEKYKTELNIAGSVDAASALGSRRQNLVYSEVMKKRSSFTSAADFIACLDKNVENIDKLDKQNTTNNSGSRPSGGGTSTSISMPSGTNQGKPMSPSEGSVPAVAFNDLKNVPWATEAINALVKDKIISGRTSSEFCPNDNITRSEFVKLVSELFQYTDEKATCNFKDVPETYWGYSYIASAFANGVIQGYKDLSFDPENFVTREEIATIIYRGLNQIQDKFYGIDTAKNEFTDFDQVSEYAVHAVVMLQSLKLINGYEDGTFQPQGNATRAETAVIIYNISNYLKK